MSQAKPLLSRRAMVAALLGGGAIAAAFARPMFRTTGAGTFEENFRSPFFSLGLGDHSSWNAEVGTQVQVSNGPAMRVAGVETFIPFGTAKTGSTRGRAFMVSFEITDGGTLAGDMIYTLNHASRGSFQLFLTSPAGSPTIAQAMFS